MSLNTASRVHHALSVNVGFVRGFGGSEIAKAMPHSSGGYFGPPNPISTITYSKEPAGVVNFGSSLVLHIFGNTNQSEVANPIVRWLSVDVINVLTRMFTVNVKPRKTMGEVSFLVNHHPEVAEFLGRPRTCPDFHVLAALSQVCEDARALVVGKKLLQPFLRQGDLDSFWYRQSRVKEVCNSVIASVFVFAVNAKSWKFAMNIKPRKVGGFVFEHVNSNNGASVRGLSTCDIPRQRLTPPRKAMEYSSLGVVVKKLFEAGLSEFRIFGSHAVVPFKQWFGQKPRRVISTAGLRHFSCSQPYSQGFSL